MSMRDDIKNVQALIAKANAAQIPGDALVYAQAAQVRVFGNAVGCRSRAYGRRQEVKPMRCTYCGKATHTIRNCPSTASGQCNRLHMHCTYCGGNDHLIEACPKTWGGSAARHLDRKSVEDFYVKD